MTLKQLSERLRPFFLEQFSLKPSSPCVIFLSASDMNSRALVRHASSSDPSQAWDRAFNELELALGSLEPKILRADWIVNSEQTTWSSLNQTIEKTRRGYFRRGISLPDFSLAFTENELNADCLFFNAKEPRGKFNPDNANAYCKARFDREFPALEPNDPILSFETSGAFVSDDLDQPQPLDPNGHRFVSELDKDFCLEIARNGADHLARQILDDGRFVYGLLPCFGRKVSGYNTLRHFSSIFAMLDVYETYDRSNERAKNLMRAITRGLDYAVNNFVRWRTLEDGSQAAYIEEPSSKEFKLGALGVPIVALAKFTEITRTPKYMLLMKGLARAIKTMQKPDGSFVHVLNSEDYSLKEPFRIVYYDGEAVFGLMKLYSLTRDPQLLEWSELAFKRFVATDHWKNHDHWLSYAVNELTRYQPKREYFEFGINNFLGHLRFIYHRSTQFPTLMELMMAADTMLERIKSMPEMSDLLKRVNFDDFYAAMEARAKNMLNGYFYPEQAMYFARPNSIVGSFYMRHYAFRVRNDDVEHFLSGFANYLRHLSKRTGDPKPSAELVSIKPIRRVEPKPPVEVAQPLIELNPIESKTIETKPSETKPPVVIIPPPAEKKPGEAEIFYAGDFVIARRMHWRAREVRQLGNIPAMKRADMRLVNLECVVATAGEQGVEKGEGGPYYYHARPEMLNIVTNANVDVVLTANNHIGDYGEEAILEQRKYLDEAGLIHVGSGANVEEASAPIFVRVNDLIVAIFSVETVTKQFAATEDRAGAWYLPLNETELWRSIFSKKISSARRHADLVIVAPHWWGADFKPTAQIQTIGRLLIDCGADAVLGCHSHNIQGLENYKGRPIVYDAGNFLFEAKGGEKDTGCFSLTVDRSGVKRIEFTPLKNGYGYVVMATRSRDRINEWFAGMCRELGTEGTIKDGVVSFEFDPPPRGEQKKVSAPIESKPSEPSKKDQPRPRARWFSSFGVTPNVESDQKKKESSDRKEERLEIDPIEGDPIESDQDQIDREQSDREQNDREQNDREQSDRSDPIESEPIDETPPTIFDLPREHHSIKPLAEPLPNWTVDRVPEEARIEPIDFGPIKLVGYRIPPECRVMTYRHMLFVETYWTIDQPLDADCRLLIEGKPVFECRMPNYGLNMEHDFCDWMWPVKRWKAGVIYREKFGLRPPEMRRLCNIDLRVDFRVQVGDQIYSATPDPTLIKMQLKHLPFYRREFPEIVFQSTPNCCWTPEQLVAITGGKWLVPPSEGWYVNSVTRSQAYVNVVRRPTMYVASTGDQLNFHEGSNKSRWDTHKAIPRMLQKTVGAIVSHEVEGLPKDYPLLLVDDPIKAIIDIGLAARARFQGKVIAITGTVGKSTVSNMLEHAMSDRKCITTHDNYNSRVGVPVTLASLPQDFDYAILEIAMSALWMNRGPITYDVRPHVSILTQLGMSQTIHTAIKNIKDMAMTKAKVFKGLTPDGVAVFHDQLEQFDYILDQAKKYASRVIVCGTSEHATSKILEIKDTPTGHDVRASIEGEEVSFSVSPHGMASVMNMMLVLGALKAVGEGLSTAIERLSNYKTMYGRLEYNDVEFDGKPIRVIDDSWNAEVLSFKRALDAAPYMKKPNGRLIGVLGRIVNLGPLAEQLHRGMRDMVVDAKLDYIVTHGDEMVYLRDELPKENLGPHFSDAPALIEHLKTILKPDDTVLIKGSRRDSDFGTIGLIMIGQNDLSKAEDLPIEPKVNEALKKLGERLKPKFLEHFDQAPSRPCRLFLSTTDGRSSIFRNASDLDPNDAWIRASELLNEACETLEPTSLRADWVVDVEAMTWSEFKGLIAKNDRFNRGLSLPDFSIALTAEELRAERLIEGGKFDLDRADEYCKARFELRFPEFKGESSIAVFKTRAVIVEGDSEPRALEIETSEPSSAAASERSVEASEASSAASSAASSERDERSVEASVASSERDVELSEPPKPEPEPKNESLEAEIFYAGDFVLARRMHWLVNEVKKIDAIEAMKRADLRIVNLESVISTVGEQGVEKGEGGPFYYHARPEQTNILIDASVDVVLTANNHCGDYGPEAVLEQRGYLDRAGLIHAGSGANIDEASAPTFVKVNGLIIALFSVDGVTKYFAATEDRAGTWFLPLNEPELWRAAFEKKIADARLHADLVFVAPHWYGPETKTLGHILIDCGADAVLGCHSHNIRGVEKYKERPIIYDAGNFVFDVSGETRTGCFSLSIDRTGVKRVNFTPLKGGYGFAEPAEAAGESINEWFAGMCTALETETEIKDGTVEIKFAPTPRDHAIGYPGLIAASPKIFEPPLEHTRIEPLSEPLPNWTVERVPNEAIIRPRFFGPLTLVGYYIPPECRLITSRHMLYVETYWMVRRPTKSDCRLAITAKPLRECRMPTFGASMAHDFCDWMWPVDRWKPGVIYRERFGLRPPEMKKLCNVELQPEIRVTINGKLYGPFVDPQRVELAIEKLPHYRSKFPDIIYRSKPGQCWNAKQLEAVSGGEWIVEPPEGWFVQSFFRSAEKPNVVPAPRMFIANSFAQHIFHAGGDPKAQTWDTHAKLKNVLETSAGAIVSKRVEGLPPDYPQLLVDDPVRVGMELGFAARQRFQGRTIGITGSSGKTTTTYMLKHVLGHDHEVTATHSSINTRVNAPLIFANVRQDMAFAIIEFAVSSLNSARGSITYELKPDIAVVTSLAAAHLETYGSIDEVARLKSRVMCGMEPGGYAILNRDMPRFEIFLRRANSLKLNVITFGTHPDSTLRMERVENGGTFTYNGKSYVIECDGPAEHVYDALAVVGVSIASGLSIERTLELIKTFRTVGGRGNRIDAVFNGKNIRVINSSFNANPLSMKGALDYLKTLEPEPKKRVAILGDMAELGRDEIKLHRGVAGLLDDVKPDRLTLVGKLMKNLFDDVKDRFDCTWFPSYKEAIAGIDERIKDGDTILAKSSHSTHLDHLVTHLTKTKQPAPSMPKPKLNVPSVRFDVKEFLPEGITPEMNGRMPSDRMQTLDNGAALYVDAARSLKAMIEAARLEGLTLYIIGPFSCYRPIEVQEGTFQRRFTPLDANDKPRDGAVLVEYEGKIWELNEGEFFAAVPGTSSHGFGLAVDINNANLIEVEEWLKVNAESFGFKQELDSEPWHYTYVRARKGLTPRVLEIEKHL